MIIYKATNNINGKSYIGKTIDALKKRKGSHYRSRDNTYFHRAIKKFGKNNFNWIVLEQSITDFEILKELEIYWIGEFNTKVPNGYNMTDGGEGMLGYQHTNKTKRKIGDASKKRIITDEARKNMSEARKGIVFSEEHKRKLSKWQIGRVSPMKGKNHTEEAKKKIKEKRAKQVMEPWSDERKKKMSEDRMGEKNPMYGKKYKCSEETKKKISDARRKKL